MKATINFFSEKEGEIKKFLSAYYAKNFILYNHLFWKKEFENPIDMIDMISCFIDNNDKFQMNLWISLDKDIYICIGNHNLDKIIRYLYERYPY